MEKLDNPVWYSLCETHKSKAIEFEDVKFYDPNYCPFGGFTDIAIKSTYLDQYAELVSDFYIVGQQPKFNNRLILNKELVCNQMVLDKNIEIGIDNEIVELHIDHKDDLFNLANLVQPGYFKNKTSELGNYYGIYKDNQLVAVTGERMKMNDFTEVSAIVTHPKYTGQGLAKKLVAYTSNRIFFCKTEFHSYTLQKPTQVQ